MADANLISIGSRGELNPAQATELRNQLQREGLEFEERPSTASGTYIRPYGESELIARQAREAVERGVSTLEQGKTEIAPIYKSRQDILLGELEPTTQRYNALLEEVTRRQQEDTNLATKTQANELGRRGISNTSGLYDRTVQEALSPILQYYTGQAKDVGFEREGAIRSIQNAVAELANQQALQELGLTRDIANLQTTGGINAAQLAAGLLAQRQAQAEAESLASYRNATLDLQRQAQERGLTTVDLGDRVGFFDPQGNLVQSYSKGRLTGASGGGQTASNFLNTNAAPQNTTNNSILDTIFGNLELVPQTSSATLNTQGF